MMSESNASLDLTLVVACYNEERVLERNLARTIEVLEAAPWRYEVILADDGSSDRTPDLIARVCDRSAKKVRALYHPENLGRGRTVSDGFRVARGRVAGFIDIDLEIDAETIPILVRAIEAGADVATARRVHRLDRRSVGRWFLSRAYSFLVRRLLDLPLQDTEAGCKFFRKRILRSLLEEIRSDGWFWDTEVMARAYVAGHRIVEIPRPFVRGYEQPSSVRVILDTLGYLKSLWQFRSELKRLASE